MKFILLIALIFAVTLADNNNIVSLSMEGEALMDEMQKDDNKDLVFVVQFKKVNGDDKALTAANENQKEGIINKLNKEDQLEENQKARFQVVEVKSSNAKLMKKWKIKDSAADKRPVFLVAKGGQGKTFSGPLATTKALDYFKTVIPEVEEGGDDAAAGDAGEEAPARR